MKKQSIPELWEQLTAWFTQNQIETSCPDQKHGATDEELEIFELIIGYELPSTVRENYKLFDGDNGLSYKLLGQFDFTPLEYVLKAWEMCNDLFKDEPDPDPTVNADSGVRPTWWHPAWIPIGRDDSGQYLCIDFAPAEGGQVGQIVRFDHMWEGRVCIAPSWEELLAQFVEDLYANRYEIIDNENGYRYIEFLDKSRKW